MKVSERLVLDYIKQPLCAAETNLETSGNTVRITFFYFSYAFNSIQPALLKNKINSQIDHSMDAERSTGVPQGTVLAPFLFTVYMLDFQYNLQTFSDDCWLYNGS